MADLTPYSTAEPFFGVLQGWLSIDDAQRLAAYQLYEAMYRNDSSAYELIRRGSESNPIYIPSAKTIIEACNRYLAKSWTFAIDPRLGTPADRDAVKLKLDTLFRREEMWSKFATQKRFGLIRGDTVWHITGDLLKPLDKRISVYEIDPAAYFPIYDDVNTDRLVGCHIAEPMLVAIGSTEIVIRRQTYRKDLLTGAITYEVTFWETGGWDDRPESAQVLKQAKKTPDDGVPVAVTVLDPRITAIPVYHIKNNRTPMAPFGSSELQGLERVAAGVSQSISDAELSLALAGLGVYVTTSGSPVDENDEETEWVIGPGYVAEIDPESTFVRLKGITSVTPVTDLVSYLEKAMREASGTPEIAIGQVDVAVAESGIALQLKMGPLLAKNAEKEQEMLAIYDHMLYDLTHMWFPVFEDLDAPDIMAVSIVDDPMPMNRKSTLDEIIIMLTNGVISIAYAQSYISEKLGYDFPDEMLATIVEEQKAIAAVRNLDPFMSRVAQELGEAGA